MNTYAVYYHVHICNVRGGGPRGARGAQAPLELGIYRVKFLKIRKISFFLLIGPPLGKIHSSAPADGV